MGSSDLRREENYSEFLRLLQDPDYIEVTYDEKSSGVSAVHIRHKLSKQYGPYGIRRGDYERLVLDVLRKAGYRIVLAEEPNDPGVKSFDGFLNDVPMEIKTIEGQGVWNICSKLHQAAKQAAEYVVLYFPDKSLYSDLRMQEGLRLYQTKPESSGTTDLNLIIAIVENKIAGRWNKKATPIEGWSI